jgi:hypothetical protein
MRILEIRFQRLGGTTPWRSRSGIPEFPIENWVLTSLALLFRYSARNPLRRGIAYVPSALTNKAGMSFSFMGIVLATPPSIKDSRLGTDSANFRIGSPSPRPKRGRGVGNKPNRVNILFFNKMLHKWEKQTQTLYV